MLIQGFFKKKGSDLLSHLLAVPSALLGLTSLFGMGRGEPQCYNHPKLVPVKTGISLIVGVLVIGVG